MSWIKRHPLVAYFILAYAITWLLVIPLIASAQGLLDIRISPICHFVGAFGPILAAFIVTGITGRVTGIREFTGRMLRWRVRIGWTFVALLSPFALFALSAVILRIFGSPWPDLSQLGQAEEFANCGWLASLILPSIAYGIGEETGWRGFALPRLTGISKKDTPKEK